METVFECGTDVNIKIANIKGIITCISLRFGRVIYEVSYFVNGKQETVWVNEAEFETTATKTQGIGFKNGGHR